MRTAAATVGDNKIKSPFRIVTRTPCGACAAATQFKINNTCEYLIKDDMNRCFYIILPRGVDVQSEVIAKSHLNRGIQYTFAYIEDKALQDHKHESTFAHVEADAKGTKRKREVLHRPPFTQFAPANP